HRVCRIPEEIVLRMRLDDGGRDGCFCVPVATLNQSPRPTIHQEYRRDEYEWREDLLEEGQRRLQQVASAQQQPHACAPEMALPLSRISAHAQRLGDYLAFTDEFSPLPQRPAGS